MNMCSVRQRPMPSAPCSSAFDASAGVSALARTPSRRTLSAQLEHALEARSLRPGSTSGTSSRVTMPVLPSIAIRCAGGDRHRRRPGSPVRAGRSPARRRRPRPGRPMPRATSAACEALPPSEVRMPRAAWKPATSSASVNGRARITSRPCAAAATASSAVKTIRPWPRRARRPRRGPAPRSGASRVERRVQQRVEGTGVDRGQRLLGREQPLVDRVDREAHGGLCRALGAARLQHVQAPALDVNSTSCMSP